MNAIEQWASRLVMAPFGLYGASVAIQVAYLALFNTVDQAIPLDPIDPPHCPFCGCQGPCAFFCGCITKCFSCGHGIMGPPRPH